MLIAYSNHNKDIGYCQGLNYIAGLILLVTKNEEWTFWLLKVLVEKITSEYHTKTMTGLITDIAVLRELLMERVPEVCEHLERCGLPCAVITTKWFICMFAEVLPIETVLRIWDCLFHEGSKVSVISHTQTHSYTQKIHIICRCYRLTPPPEPNTDCECIYPFQFQILFRVCLTLFISHKIEILECEEISALANLFRCIIRDEQVTDCHRFLESIFSVPGTIRRRDVEQLRQTVTVQLPKKTL